VLQKLLTAAVAAAIVETGSDQVGGYVTAASEVAALRTPADLLAAYGVDASPEFADVVRFEQPRLATFSAPSSEARPWQTFPRGFLLAIHSRAYGTWDRPVTPSAPNTGGFVRTVSRSAYRTTRALLEAGSGLGSGAPAGFQQVRPGAWSSTVGWSECEIFERVYTAALDGVPVRLLRRTGPQAEVLLLSDDPAAADRLQARLVEPAVYEATVDAGRLANVQGVENQLAPTNG
jgi:hypothetical protein